MKKVSIFGSTGFVGQRAVGVVCDNTHSFEVEALVANSNVHLLATQAKILNAKMAVIAKSSLYSELQSLLSGTGIRVCAGPEGVAEAASIKVDSAIMAISGVVALDVVLRLIETGIPTIALANKESIVCGGNLLINAARSRGVQIVPLDSEHNAVFRILCNGGRPVKITLTASGGPFLNWTIEQMRHATAYHALNHPIWKMGRKISIDSATMANKALEIIEARYLFSLNRDNIDVLVHPESIVHALVTYGDGATFTLMSEPDMSFPIFYALYWPEGNGLRQSRLNLAGSALTFLNPDVKKFPILQLGFEILGYQNSHAAGVVFNASNEVAVEAFLNSEISFLDIGNVVFDVMDNVSYGEITSFEDIKNYDRLGRVEASKAIGKFVHCEFN